MKLIIGLGNPGSKYLKNRHNVGHMFVNFLQGDAFDTKEGMAHLQGVAFLKTKDTFMNESGKFVAKKVRVLGVMRDLGKLYIVHDDLDIPLGQYKIQFGVGPKVHNGIASVEKELGTKDFWRIRIGVDNRDPNNRTPGEEYVLQNFNAEELKILEGVFKEIYEKLRIDIG